MTAEDRTELVTESNRDVLGAETSMYSTSRGPGTQPNVPSFRPALPPGFDKLRSPELSEDKPLTLGERRW
jgi:hypothetical protein